MVALSKDMSRELGYVVSSPFVQSLAWKEYDYDDLVGQKGFCSGWQQRAIAAGSIDQLRPEDKAFYDVCMKSRELIQQLKVSNPLTPDDRGKILDALIELGMIESQFSFGQ